MKKIIAVLFIVAFASSMIFAQGALPSKADKFVSGKIGLGAFYGANLGFGGGFEYILQEDFLNLGDIPASLGFGAEVGYSSYTKNYNFGGFYYSNFNIASYKVKTTNIVILGSAFYHANVLKIDKLDTYVKFSLGYNVAKSKYDGPSDYDYQLPSVGGIIAGSAIGARYFFTPALSAVAEFGYGFGILRLGLDFAL